MATLAGLGADFIVVPSRRLEQVSGYGLVVGLAILLATVAVRLLPLPAVKLTFVSALAKFAVLLTIASLLLFYRQKAEFWPRESKLIKLPHRLGISPPVLWQTLVITFIAADLIIFGYALNPTTEPRLYEFPITGGAFFNREDKDYRIFTSSRFDYDLKFNKYLRFDDFGPSDVDWLMGLRETLMPNLAIGEGLFSANNFDPLVVGCYKRLVQEVDKGLPRWIDPNLGRTVDEAHLPVALRLLSLMNVRYILDYGGIPDLNLIFSNGIRIYRNDDALPRAYVVSQARVISDDEELLTELLDQTFNPRRTVLLRPASGQKPFSYFPTADPLSLIPLSPEYSPNTVKIEVALDRDGYLVLSDIYYPGWRAYVDGEEREILRANYAFRAVPLESGQHIVLFKYDPLSFKVGLAISLITWGAIIFGLTVPGLQRHKREHSLGRI
jgi:hypothetical protein